MGALLLRFPSAFRERVYSAALMRGASASQRADSSAANYLEKSSDKQRGVRQIY